MKRTLAFSLYLGIATLVAAQTATVAEKPATRTNSASPSQAAPAKPKPSPLGAGVTVVAAGAQKPAQASSANALKGKGTPAPALTPVAKPTPAPKPGTQVVEVPRGKSPFSTHKKLGSPEAKRSSGLAGESDPPELPAQVVRKIGAAGRRDPFISPVVNLSAIGSGCSSGKRCLSIEQIALRGVVRSETGMIAVVVNALDKAYFLRENDPVFNGYVEKITPDSIVFRETFHDRLGKAFTRDVTKSINRPAA